MSKSVDALQLIFKNCRFDLIFKYLYSDACIRCDTAFINSYEEMYCESIRAFNGYYEEEPRKESREDFLNSFNLLIKSVCENGFHQKSVLPVSSSYDLQNECPSSRSSRELGFICPC